MRTISDKEMCHERLGGRFHEALSDYDTKRRIDVLIDEFFEGHEVRGKRAIDVGCGLGFFSRRLREFGADVVACDIGPSLVEHAAKFAGCKGVRADCLHLAGEFGESQFDLVVSSECIEHTPDPAEAVRQMIKVLRPGGLLAISTPNIVWLPITLLATRLRLRPFNGLENFSSWNGLRRTLEQNGVHVLREKGLHLFPFQLPLHRMSRWTDERLQIARCLMINICMLGKKRATGQI